MQLADVRAKARELLQGDAGRCCELHGDAAAARCCSLVGSALHGDGVLHLHLLVSLSGHAPAVLPACLGLTTSCGAATPSGAAGVAGVAAELTTMETNVGEAASGAAGAAPRPIGSSNIWARSAGSGGGAAGGAGGTGGSAGGAARVGGGTGVAVFPDAGPESSEEREEL
eukprot:scaffold3003_cov59-Phaeocystis_antarctica.AAC.5